MRFFRSMRPCADSVPKRLGARAAVVLAVALAVLPAVAQEGKPPTPAKPKIPPPVAAPSPAPVSAAPAAAAPDAEASRYCANVAPSIAEARIVWQTKKLADLDAQVRQRIADLEKAEASARDWIARRDEAMKAASDDVVAIYSKMQAENAAREISGLDDRVASAILAKMKPNTAAAILSEMEADRASRLSAMIASGGEKKS
jgi:flagellar motility protein MotE (MotC chaperone)